MQDSLRIEPTGANDFNSCPCCGRNSRKVWGFVWQGEAAVACFFVHWTLGHIEEFGANFDFIVGKWGDGTSSSDRSAISLEYRLLESGPTFRVIDATERPVAESELTGHVLLRSDVIGKPISNELFAYCDTIMAQDVRITEVLGGWTIGRA